MRETQPCLCCAQCMLVHIYLDCTNSLRQSEQFFVRHIKSEVLGERAHSIRCVTSSLALVKSASLADVCRAEGWATPNTTRFYNLHMAPVSSTVLHIKNESRCLVGCRACVQCLLVLWGGNGCCSGPVFSLPWVVNTGLLSSIIRCIAFTTAHGPLIYPEVWTWPGVQISLTNFNALFWISQRFRAPNPSMSLFPP